MQLPFYTFTLHVWHYMTNSEPFDSMAFMILVHHFMKEAAELTS